VARAGSIFRLALLLLAAIFNCNQLQACYLPSFRSSELHVGVYLNPDSGRFWTRDTWEGNVTRPLSFNGYLYVLGSPTIYIDPRGTDFSLPGILNAMGVNATIDRTKNLVAAQAGRRAIVKAGCVVLDEVAETAITEGVYILIFDGGKAYVGQSSDLEKRIRQHLKKFGDKLEGVVKVFNLEGFSKTQRELFEQLVIDQLGGIDNLKNERNPVSAARKLSSEFAEKVGGVFKLCK